MSGLVGDLLVALAVLTSVLYAAARLGPKPWRARAFASLAAALDRLPAWGGERRLSRWLCAWLTAAATRAGGCGGCGDCADRGPGGAAPTPAAEVHIPPHKIGRRG